MYRITPWWVRSLALFFILALSLFGMIRSALTRLSLHFLVNPTLDCSNLMTYEGKQVRFNTSSRLKISGLYFPSAHPKTPAVIVCHGSGQTIRSTARIAHWLSQEGFAVLTFDYRGFGQSQGELNSYRDLTRDLESAIRFLTRQKHVDAGRIGIMGLSLGTVPAIQTASRNRRVKALLLQGTVYSGIHVVSGIFPDPWVKFCAKYLIDLDGLDNRQAIRRLRCPVFMIQEADDWITLPRDGARLFAMAPEPKSYWYVPDAGHLDAVLRQPDEYRLRVTRFFKETLLKDKTWD